MFARFFDTLLRRKKKVVPQKNLPTATAKSVLQFVAHGLTYGVNSITHQYQPPEKAQEFVAISANVLRALYAHQQEDQPNAAAMISVHVNGMAKKISLCQIGADVMLSLDECITVISLTSLAELYANLRNDMLQHADIYGKSLQDMAKTLPASPEMKRQSMPTR